jgi:hypothetical protein
LIHRLAFVTLCIEETIFKKALKLKKILFFIGQKYFFGYRIAPAFRSEADLIIGIEGEIAF